MKRSAPHPGPPHEPGNIEHRMKRSPHLISLRSEATARQALTLSPPIRVSTLTLSLSHQNGRGNRRGNQPSLRSYGSAGSRRAQRVTRETGGLRQVQGFNARTCLGKSLPVWRGEGGKRRARDCPPYHLEIRSRFIDHRRQEFQSEPVAFEHVNERVIKSLAVGQAPPP